MDCAVSPGNVGECVKPGSCLRGFQSRVWGEGRGPPGISTQSLTLHHCAGVLVMCVSGWCSLGGPICRWSCHHCWLLRGMCREALDMERSNGEEWVEGKCRKDKGHDLFPIFTLDMLSSSVEMRSVWLALFPTYQCGYSKMLFCRWGHLGHHNHNG